MPIHADLLRVRASRLRAPRILARELAHRATAVAVPSLPSGRGRSPLTAARCELSTEDRFGSEATHPGGVPVSPRPVGLVLPLPAAGAGAGHAAARVFRAERGPGGRWHSGRRRLDVDRAGRGGRARGDRSGRRAARRGGHQARPRGVQQPRRAAPFVPRQRRHRSRRQAARDGARARPRAVPVRADRSCRSAVAAQRRVVRGRRSRAWTDRHQSGRPLRVQRRRRRCDQGVSLPRQRSDRGGHPCRRQRPLGRAVGPGPAQPERRRSS